MKFMIQLICAACSENVMIRLRDLGDESQLKCPNCGRSVPVDPELTWRLLRRLREEIRQATSSVALAKEQAKEKMVVGK